MLRAQSGTVTSYQKNATSSTTGYENDFACHFLGASAREARRWAHSTVRPGSTDDSTGRPGCADDSILGLKQPMKKVLVSREEAVTSRTAPVAREALAIVPFVREIEDMQSVPFSWDEPTTNHIVQTPRRARDRGAHPVEDGGRGGRGAVARVWHG